MPVASMRWTSHGAAISCVNVASFTSTSAPGRSLGSIGSQNSSCIAIADHERDTIGGVSSGSSPMTTVPSVLPPRIMPP